MEHSSEYYREKIVEMVNKINNVQYLYKIYNYILVPYKLWNKENRGN